MPTKYYLDACIWIDYFENRSDRFRPLGEWALDLIKKIIRDEDIFVISGQLIKELSKEYSSEKLANIFKIVPKALTIQIETKECYNLYALRMKNKYKIPFGDALHLAIAKYNQCILVTRDNHFNGLDEGVQINKPEELI